MMYNIYIRINKKSMRKFYVLAAILFALVLVAPALASEPSTITLPTVNGVTTTVTSEPLDDVQPDAVPPVTATVTKTEKTLGAWGQFWTGIKEQLSLVFTFNPEKRAEKAMAFANERLKYAEGFLAAATTDQAREKAQKMIDRANELITKISTKADDMKTISDDKKQALAEKVAEFTQKKEDLLTQIEEKISAIKNNEFGEARVKALEKSQALVNALENPDLTPEKKAKLEAIQAKITTHLEEVKTFQDKKVELLEKIKSGDETAKTELEEIREAFKTQQEQQREESKQLLENIRETNKQILEKQREEAKNLNEDNKTEEEDDDDDATNTDDESETETSN